MRHTSAVQAARRAFRKSGFDVIRWPDRRYESQRQALLKRRDIATVVDVGANEGQYGRALRNFGFDGRILSIEPLPVPFRLLDAAAGRDGRWRAVQAALGERQGTAVINVSANAGASSSLLPMLDQHERAAPEARYIGSEVVHQETLDSLASDPWIVEPVHLKLDVQGYEKWVLRGATATLPRISTLEIELSFLPLYEDGMLFSEAIEMMASLGFSLAHLHPTFYDVPQDLLLQADGLFVRN